MKNDKLKIGQILFGNDLREYEISKIGNKYFECKNMYGKFYIETLKFVSKYSNKTQLYIDKQNLLDIKEVSLLESKLRIKIGSYGKTNLTLEQLRKIDLIINDNNDQIK